MKTISIRMLASTIKTLTEPVEVVTLDKASKQVIALGVFVPKGVDYATWLGTVPKSGQKTP